MTERKDGGPAFEKIVHVSGAFDKRHADPKKDYGISACRIRFVLKGPLGATQFVVGTDWYLPSIQRAHRQRDHDSAVRFDRIQPEGWDVGYHAPEAQYEGQPDMECDLMESGRCYYDGSSLRADDWVPKFIEGGTDWLWAELQKEYEERFQTRGERDKS